MNNWILQDIQVGDIVWRGSRDGNTSNFKIGRVIALKEDSQQAKVKWMFQHSSGFFWKRDEFSAAGLPLNVIQILDNSGTCTIHSLTKINVDLTEIERVADAQAELIKTRT